MKEELKETFERLGTAIDKDCSILLSRVIEKTAERQNGRIESLMIK